MQPKSLRASLMVLILAAAILVAGIVVPLACLKPTGINPAPEPKKPAAPAAMTPDVAALLEERLMQAPDAVGIGATPDPDRLLLVLSEAEVARLARERTAVEDRLMAALAPNSEGYYAKYGAAYLLADLKCRRALPVLRQALLKDRYFYGWEGPDYSTTEAYADDTQYSHHLAYITAIERISGKPIAAAVALTDAERRALEAEAARAKPTPEDTAPWVAKWLLAKLSPAAAGAKAAVSSLSASLGAAEPKPQVKAVNLPPAPETRGLTYTNVGRVAKVVKPGRFIGVVEFQCRTTQQDTTDGAPNFQPTMWIMKDVTEPDGRHRLQSTFTLDGAFSLRATYAGTPPPMGKVQKDFTDIPSPWRDTGWPVSHPLLDLAEPWALTPLTQLPTQVYLVIGPSGAKSVLECTFVGPLLNYEASATEPLVKVLLANGAVKADAERLRLTEENPWLAMLGLMRLEEAGAIGPKDYAVATASVRPYWAVEVFEVGRSRVGNDRAKADAFLGELAARWDKLPWETKLPVLTAMAPYAHGDDTLGQAIRTRFKREFVTPLAWSYISLADALREEPRIVIITRATEPAYISTSAMAYATQKFNVVQVLNGRTEDRQVAVSYDFSLAGNEREVQNGEQVIWIAQPSVTRLLDLPTWRGRKVLPDTPENRKRVAEAIMAAPKAAAKPPANR